MDSEPDRELQVIREQTHQTRAHLAEKLEALESKVSKTVSGVTDAVETVKDTVTGVTDAVSNATEAVTDVVSNVTESVAGTVENVKETVAETVNALDVQPYIRQAPFTSVGCAFATGLAAGYFMGPPKGNGSFMPFNLTGETAVPRDAEPKNGHQATTTTSNTLGAVGETVSELGGSFRSLGISALMGLVSHLAKQAVPEAMKQDVCTALDKLKTRLGGHHNVNPETFLKQ
jgi:ElaB/YqjD/DUF883 family membrane-anchored ribosome-binding protein